MSTEQPETVTTEDTPRPADIKVVTDENQTSRDAQTDQAAPATPAEPNADASAPTVTKPATTSRDRASERRIKKLSNKLSASETRNAENEARIAELETTVGSLAAATPAKPEPKYDDFNSPQEYAKEYSKWEAETAAPPSTPASTPRQPATPARPVTTTDELPAAPKSEPTPEFKAFKDKGTKLLGPDFAEALDDETAKISPTIADFVLDSPHGPEIYLHLVDNPEVANGIAFKTDGAARARLQKLEEQAKAGKLVSIPPATETTTDTTETPAPTNTIQATAPRQTRAPNPPKEQATESNAHPVDSMESLPMEEYAARRRETYKNQH